MAELLLEKEVIFKDDLEKIFGKRPFEEEVNKENTDADNKNGKKKSTTASSNGKTDKDLSAKEKSDTPADNDSSPDEQKATSKS